MRTAHWPIAVVALSALCFARGALADDNEATAQALFDQAMRDMASGAYERACPALVDVVRLSHGIGAMIALAKCYEAEGRLASAWGSWKAAADTAVLAQDKRAAFATAKANALFGRLPRLRITAAPAATAAPGFKVRRDDVELDSALWNTALPVDPGKHVVTATAPGKRSWRRTVEVPGGGEPVTVEVPPLDDLPAEPTAALTAPPQRGAPASSAKVAPLNEGSRRWSLAILGGGLAALAGGALFGAAAASAESHAHDLCPNAQCPFTSASTQGQQIHSLVSERTTDEVVAGVFAGVGTVGVIVGTLGVLSHGSTEPQTHLIVLPNGLRLAWVFQ